jgi:translation initiation factor 1A
MFGIVTKFEGASHLTVFCADNQTRLSRIPGKMKRRSWITVGDLVIVKPWSVENGKADIVFRYTRTQRGYLARKKILPPGLE